MSKKEIAHLFWHGELTKLEEICVKSFVKNGFDTKIWSYTGIEIDGAESCDARLVLPEEDLTKYKQRHFKITDGSKESYSTLAAFSDAFRWNVISKFGGWWFDTDAYCLKHESEFKKLRGDKQLIAGVQDHKEPSINSGIFYANKVTGSKLVNHLNKVCDEHNYIFDEWGAIGPLLISDFIQEFELYDCVVTTDKFYSIEYNQFNYFANPKLKNISKSLIKDSYVAHIWHSQLGLHNIDKNNPPKDSLLEDFYNGTFSNNIEVDNHRMLDFKYSLERYIAISKIYKKILKRSGDVIGIKTYVSKPLSYVEIEDIFKNSDEYKNG